MKQRDESINELQEKFKWINMYVIFILEGEREWREAKKQLEY